MDGFYFRTLDVYKNSKTTAIYVCSLLKKYPSDEKFALCSQIRRAVTSIPINIAEGFGRFSSKERAQFLNIAMGSLTEVLCEMEISLELSYISVEEFQEVENRLTIIAKQITKLHNKLLENK